MSNEIDDLDDILGDIIDEIPEVEPMEQKIDNTLNEANKFLTLMETFDIEEGSNMEENLKQNKIDIITDLEKKQLDNIPPEITNSIVNSNELLDDFILVREALREDIRSTRLLLSSLSEQLTVTGTEELNGTVVMAYAEMKKANVKSMELLIASYSQVAETQLKVKKLANELETAETESNKNGTNIQNAVFVGSASDILDSLKKLN